MKLTDLIPPELKLAALCAAVAGIFALGWVANGWFRDSQELAEQKGAEAAIAAFEKKESAVAAAVEARLADLKANERVIEREKLKILERPVYRAQCLDADGLRLLQAAFAGQPAKPAGQVPAAAGTAGNHRR